MTNRSMFFSVAICAFLSSAAPAVAQVHDPNSGIQYTGGQDVQPAFEGWRPNSDGSYTFYFGYLNRNYEEQIDVPIGPDNMFESGNPDQGQPTHFYTRRHMFVFTIKVGKDWGPDQKLVWVLKTHGHTDRAKASLNPAWQLDNGTISENAGSGVVDWSNEAPTITGGGAQTITLSEMAVLKVDVKDDGLPKPKVQRHRGAEEPKGPPEPTGIPNIIPPQLFRPAGVSVKWILYRGPGSVHFDPPEVPPVYGQPVSSTTKVKFSVPGVYRIRAVASDGALETPYDFDITVKAQ